MRQPGRIAGSTLRIIAEFWNARRAVSSRALVEATAMPPAQVHQILKRLVKARWLKGERELCTVQRERGGTRLMLYRLTHKGWRESRALRQQHAVLLGGRWRLTAASGEPLPRLGQALCGEESVID